MTDDRSKLKELQIEWMKLYHRAVNNLLKDEHIAVVFHDAPALVDLPLEDMLAKVAEAAAKISKEEQRPKDLE
jgi:hypothetical protein